MYLWINFQYILINYNNTIYRTITIKPADVFKKIFLKNPHFLV